MIQKMRNRFNLDNYCVKAKDYQKYEKSNGVMIQYISQGKKKIADFGKIVLYNKKFNLGEEVWKNVFWTILFKIIFV